MSSLPIREQQLGLKASKRPTADDNKGFKGYGSGKPAPVYKKSDWQGTVKGKTTHTYKAGK